MPASASASPNPAAASAHAPAFTLGLQTALAAFVLRAIVIVAAFTLFRSSWALYLSTSDAGSFVPVAQRLAGHLPAEQLTAYDTRVFPGWPLLLAPFFALGLPEQTALLVTLALAALAPWLYARLSHDAPTSWLAVVFPSAWLLATLHPISEALYFCLMVAGCLAVRARAWFWAGLFAGALVVVRPFGIAGVLALGWIVTRQPQPGRAMMRYVAGGAVMALLLAVTNFHLYGDLLHQLRVYARPLGELNLPAELVDGKSVSGHWGWPFVHLILTPLQFSVPTWKLGYVGGTVALFLALAVLAVKRLREPAVADWQRAALAAFLINTGLSFCTGPYWAFHSVDRYLIWGLPGALVALQPVLRRWPLLGWALGLGSGAFAVLSFFLRFREISLHS